jgi:hypothetical protein
MKRRADLNAMRAVAEIRAAQCSASEMEAAVAKLAVTRSENAREDVVEALAAHFDAWDASMRGAAIDLPLARAWSTEIESTQEELGRADADLVQARSMQEAAMTQWRGAIARSDAADQMERGLARTMRAAREEAAVNALADRVTARLGRR